MTLKLLFFGFLSLTILVVYTFAGSCPHPTFIKKHICKRAGVSGAQKCAVDAAREREENGWVPTTINDLFMAYDMSYYVSGNLCYFSGSAEKYSCQINPTDDKSDYTNWICRSQGIAYAKHNIYNGHLETLKSMFDNDEEKENMDPNISEYGQ